MSRLLNRIEVYTLYLFEYLKFGEFSSLIQAFVYMFTRKSYTKGGLVRTSMGKFDTRPHTLDFQYINYAYEIGIKRFIEKENFNVFMDIGACLGEYCIWLGAKGKRCLAFEPVKGSFEMIDRNIEINGLRSNVKAYNYGLGSKHSIEFFSINEINPGASKRVNEESSTTQKFEINSLDEVYQGFGFKKDERILIKIDVEGMEVEMLEGARKFLESCEHVVLIIEEKLSGEGEITQKLNTICKFEYGSIDEYNIYARKTGNLS
ncbi:MAG: FkbM family methyltransferase [Bacteroidia bacterium]